jgi:hypothetical protein
VDARPAVEEQGLALAEDQVVVVLLRIERLTDGVGGLVDARDGVVVVVPAHIGAFGFPRHLGQLVEGHQQQRDHREATLGGRLREPDRCDQRRDRQDAKETVHRAIRPRRAGHHKRAAVAAEVRGR